VGKVAARVTIRPLIDYGAMRKYQMKIRTIADELLLGQYVRDQEGQFKAAVEGLAKFLRDLEKTGAKDLKNA
jgi:hypothetical protein